MVSSINLLFDELGNLGSFATFGDLSVRCKGTYRLRFHLISIDQPLDSLVCVMSEPFTCYLAADFPGMTPSNDLTRVLKNQGERISIRASKQDLTSTADL